MGSSSYRIAVQRDADGRRLYTIRYGVIEDLERALEMYGEETAAFLVEPIQGEAGYAFLLSFPPVIPVPLIYPPESSSHPKAT
jgi:hypothetical protein